MARYVKICPKCRSLNIRTKWQSLWFFGFPATFKCLDCGFTSYIFPEMELNEKNVKKLVRLKKKERSKVSN